LLFAALLAPLLSSTVFAVSAFIKPLVIRGLLFLLIVSSFTLNLRYPSLHLRCLSLPTYLLRLSTYHIPLSRCTFLAFLVFLIINGLIFIPHPPIFYLSLETSTEIRKYTKELYSTILEQETGQSTGFMPVGFIELATEPDRLEEYRRIAAFNRRCGVDVQEIGPADVKTLFPLCETADVLSGFYVKDDGRVNPGER